MITLVPARWRGLGWVHLFFAAAAIVMALLHEGWIGLAFGAYAVGSIALRIYAPVQILMLATDTKHLAMCVDRSSLAAARALATEHARFAAPLPAMSVASD